MTEIREVLRAWLAGAGLRKVEIEVVEPELGETRFDGAAGAVAALVGVLDLGGHEQLVARE